MARIREVQALQDSENTVELSQRTTAVREFRSMLPKLENHLSGDSLLLFPLGTGAFLRFGDEFGDVMRHPATESVYLFRQSQLFHQFLAQLQNSVRSLTLIRLA